MPNAVDRAYEVIRDGIITGRYASGDRLKEEELAAQIGVSRTPVREALRRLNSEDFVKFVPNRGAHVMTWAPEYVDEIFVLRAKIESYAAEMAAARIEEPEIKQLQELAVGMDEIAKQKPTGFMNEIAARNHKFHLLIIQATRSQHLERILDWLVQMPIMLKTFEAYEDGDLERSLNHHRELIEAFKTRDGRWAAAVMESHIFSARTAYRKAQDAAARKCNSAA